MTMAEKIEAMEQLWVSIQESPDYRPPEWHQKVLESRRAKIEKGETKFSSLQDVVDRIREARG